MKRNSWCQKLPQKPFRPFVKIRDGEPNEVGYSQVELYTLFLITAYQRGSASGRRGVRAGPSVDMAGTRTKKLEIVCNSSKEVVEGE